MWGNQAVSCFSLTDLFSAFSPLTYWRMTVMRMVTWNQSSRCSDAGAMYYAMFLTVSPPSVRKVTGWFSCHPCSFRTSCSRRRGRVSWDCARPM